MAPLRPIPDGQKSDDGCVTGIKIKDAVKVTLYNTYLLLI
jgi:hypothetical protein